MDTIEAEYEIAKRRMARRQVRYPVAMAVRYDRRISRVVISLVSGIQIAFSPRDVQGLEHAQPADLVDAEISPSGLGIHFPRLDADIYIPGLLQGALGSKRWMAARKPHKGTVKGNLPDH